MNELVKSGKSGSTARHIYKAVHAFFESQNLEFSLKSKDKPRRFDNGSRMILKEQIREIWDYVGNEFRERNRAIVAMLKDSGLRVGDLSIMNVGHHRNAITKFNEDGEAFKVYDPYVTEKTGAIAYVHLGPESVEALDSYLRAREEDGEPLPDESPLFVGREGRMTSGAISQVLTRLRDLMGAEGRKISAHSLRKFFQTSLESKGISKNFIGKYNGRTVSDSTGPYSKPEEVPGLLTETYVKNYDALRVFEDGDIKDLREKLKRLEVTKDEQIKNLEAEVARLSSGQSTEVQDLRREFEAKFEDLKRMLHEKLPKSEADHESGH